MTNKGQAVAPSNTDIETRRIGREVETARHTALSALNNERFRAALEQLSDPRSSDAVMQLQRSDGTSTDTNSVFSNYADND